MPYFKTGNSGVTSTTSRNNTTIRHGEGTISKPHETEQRIGNAVIQDKIDIKNTPLSRLTAITTNIIYYAHDVSDRNDYITNTGNVSSVSINKEAYNKIIDFVIICQEPLNVTLEKDEDKTSLMGEGTAKILPKTIKPRLNDHFIMMTLGKRNLYRVTEVTKSSIETDSAYEINYQLVEENVTSSTILNEIEKNVINTYRFIYAHVGTEFRTLFKEDEYTALETLESMYANIASAYTENFYNKDKNTYILKYDCATIKDEYGATLLESKNVIKPYVTLNPTVATPPKLNDTDIWYNSLMYDRMLIEFITKTHLFMHVDNQTFYVSKLQEDIDRWYSKTIYYALEHQTTGRLTFKYLLPSPITRVTVSTAMNLYGLVSLEPMPGFVSGCLELYPKKLLKYMYWEGCSDRSINDVSVNTYSSIVDLICETIGLYVNKREDAVLGRLLLLNEHFQEFSEIGIRDQNEFYLFPLLAFVIRKTMDRLSDENFGLAMYAK